VKSWVQLYQWGDVIDVRGDADAKRLGTPTCFNLSGFFANFNLFQQNVSFSVQLSFGEEGNIRPGEQASSGEKTLIVCWLCRLLILKLRYI
jgi:hypothetical protein